MIIDEDRIHVLTKYESRKEIKKTILSDHNILYSRFSILFDHKPKKIRKELFNFKDKEGQAAFLKETDSTELLSSSFFSNRSFPHNAKIFFKNLNMCIQKCFTKIRITYGGKNGFKVGECPILDNMKLKTELKIFLKNCSCPIGRNTAEEKLEQIEHYLTGKCAKRNTEAVREHIGEMRIEILPTKTLETEK